MCISKYIIFLSCLLNVYTITAQKNDQNWIFGVGIAGPKFPTLHVFFMKFNYAGGYDFEVPPSDSNPVIASYGRSTTSYSDKDGNLKFISNAFRIFDSSLNIMENGDTINPGFIWKLQFSKYSANYGSVHGVVGLPAPGNEDQFAYLFHQGIDTCKSCGFSSYIIATPLYYSKIDLKANGGLCAVIEKNKIIGEGKFYPPSYTKHANGRDWWIMVPEQFGGLYRRFLLTPKGIEGPWIQEIGPKPSSDKLNFFIPNFSPSGDKYACGRIDQGLYLFDFDRCTGLLSNVKVLTLTDYQDLDGFKYDHGCINFSPSGKFCYINSNPRIYQMEVDKEPLSIDTIGYCNECNMCNGDTGAMYNQGYDYLAQLAPDGNIYFSNNQPNKCIFKIQNSDKKFAPGNDVKIVQVPIPYLQAYGMVYYPNYRLGALVGSPCDTLTATTSPDPPNYGMKVYPNPSKADITFDITLPNYGIKDGAVLKVYDILGKEVYSHVFSMYSYIHVIKSGTFASGYYVASLIFKGEVVHSEKFGVMR